MNVVRFQHRGHTRWGVLHDGRVSAVIGDYATTGEFVSRASLDALDGETIDARDVAILSPVTRNQRFVCQGANYRQHMIESGVDPDQKKFNMIFTKASSCIVPAESDVVVPEGVRFLAYVRMRSPRLGEFGRINTSRAIDGHPMLVTFHQPELERALRALAESHASVTAESGVELVTLDDEGDAVRAVLRTAAGERVVRARWVVGADGACSTVRKRIGEDFVGETYAEDWLIVDAIGAGEKDFDHIEFVCDPDRPTPHRVVPLVLDEWELLVGHPRRARRASRAAAAVRRRGAGRLRPARHGVAACDTPPGHGPREARACAGERSGTPRAEGTAELADHPRSPFNGRKHRPHDLSRHP